MIASRPGHDLVVTQDALVEGVHFPQGEAPDLVARKALRVNLSDLAAKAAEPFACFLAVAWPSRFEVRDRERFAQGLAVDLKAYDLSLMGGDTVVTPGPFTVSLTAMGWIPTGGMVRRAGARPGDRVMVSGSIGDGVLGLEAVRGRIEDPDGYLAGRYRLPNPRLDLRDPLRGLATAAADVSDGLVADAGHIARASGVGMELDLDGLPLSEAALRWLAEQPDPVAARVRLATGGDDYEVVCTLPPDAETPAGLTVIGRVQAGAGVVVRAAGRAVDVGSGGWKHL